MSDAFTLPARYLALLSLLRDRSGERRAWFGDVGFRLPGADIDSRAWAERLTDARWRGMHPDLIPFAEDGFDNQFCFVRSERRSMRKCRAVVYWTYETYRAVPIASSFDGFLRWAALTAHVSVLRGEPFVDSNVLRSEIMPVLRELGVELDVASVLSSNDPLPVDVHRAVLQLDPEAPGARVALAEWLRRHDRPLEALDLCAEASFAFTDFAGARYVASRVLQADGGAPYADALAQTMQRPLVYGGDEAMPFLRDLPHLDASWTAEQMAAQGDLATDDPVWNAMLSDDPISPASWVQLALDYAGADDLENAITAACNALFFGFNDELGAEIHGLLNELYDAAGWSWHARSVARWAP